MLKENDQRVIFSDLVATRTQTLTELAALYDARGDPDQWNHFLNKIAVKYHITEKDVTGIEAKGVKHRWPVRRAGSESLVTQEDYLRLMDGMTYLEAIYVLGLPGEERSRSSVGGIVTTLYAWSNRDGSNVNVTFQNDRLVGKAQFGLR